MRPYVHRLQGGETVALPVTKAICVGRNYAAHAAELNNPIPTKPVLFMKPATSFQALDVPVTWPQTLGNCDHELELALLMGPAAQGNGVEILAVALALDLTLRDVQQKLKQDGQPWERAKAFAGACPISPWLPIAEVGDLTKLKLSLHVNGTLRQQDSVSSMLFPIPTLLKDIQQTFSLVPGDVILTGTPAGVHRLADDDQLELRLASSNGQQWQWQAKVARGPNE